MKVGVLGATGLVGQTLLQVLRERAWPVTELRLLASPRSAGAQVEFDGRPVVVQTVADGWADGLDVVLSSAGRSVSERWLPALRGTGTVAIDNTSAFRMDPTVPLVVPEVNPDDASTHDGIIANPNCSTIQAVVALAPLVAAFGAARVACTTWQSTSGSGLRGLRDLEQGTADCYPRAITGNVIPQIGEFDAGGHTTEELKMVHETRKILHLPDLRVAATTVRVPVRIGHAVQVSLQTQRPVTRAEAVEVLRAARGVVLAEADADYPTPLEVVGRDEVFVGRVREDPSLDGCGLDLWCVADNTRKGAATNAVQIAELLLAGAR